MQRIIVYCGSALIECAPVDQTWNYKIDIVLEPIRKAIILAKCAFVERERYAMDGGMEFVIYDSR